MAASLPLSMFIMSVSSIFMAANWVVWGNFKTRFRNFISNKPAWIFSLIYLLHIIGGLWSTDIDFYLDDLKIKLPLLVYPVILGSTPALSEQRKNTLMLIFCGALLISSAVSFSIFIGFTSVKIEDFRDYSPFISHIRLSLLTCVGIVWLFLSALKTKRWICRISLFLLILWLFFLLNVLQSITGFIILSLLLILFIAARSFQIKNGWLRWALIIIVFSAPPLYIGIKAVEYANSKKTVDPKTLPVLTSHGHPYKQVPEMNDRENGHQVFINIAYDEVWSEWPKRSNLHYDSLTLDGKGTIVATLVRYLSSKGLPKDSSSIWSLSEDDIKAIEHGETNYKYVNNGIGKRLYGLFQEADEYLNGSVNGSSSTQRVEYVKTGFRIFKKHPVIGVGTGDLAVSFKQQYIADNSPLEEEYRLRAHNQYLSILIGFGTIGFLIFIAGMILPAALNRTFRSHFFIGFLIIAFVSFLSEDTLETQAGVSFFIFFYGLLVWCRAKKFV